MTSVINVSRRHVSPMCCSLCIGIHLYNLTRQTGSQNQPKPSRLHFNERMVALSKTLLWLILGVYICTFVKCEPETPPDATVEPEPEGGFEDFFDEHNVHDDGHIKEHMDDIDLANHTLNKEEKEFHFFREHDTDMNQKIDGLEMLEALGHSMPFKVNIPVGHTQDQIAQMEQTAKDKWMAKLTGIIDKALKEHDTDGDGYLSYPEYVSSIRSNALKAPDAAAAAGQAAQPQQ